MTYYDTSISSRFQDKDKVDLYSGMAAPWFHSKSWFTTMSTWSALQKNSFELTLLKNKQEEESTKLFSKF